MFKAKKVLACLLSFSMTVSMAVIPHTAKATGTPLGTPDKSTEYSENRGDLTYKYLGTIPANVDTIEAESDGPWYEDGLAGLNSSNFVWENGGIVVVGLEASNMTRLKEMFNSTASSNATAGLYTASFALAFDSDYFDMTTASLYRSGSLSGMFLGDTLPVTYAMGRTGAIYTYSSNEPADDTAPPLTTLQEELATSSSMTIQPLNLTQSDPSKIKIMQLMMSGPDTIAATQKLLWMDKMRFASAPTTQVNVNDDPMLIGIFALKMKGATPPAAGTKVIEGFLDKSFASMNIGTSGTDFTLYDFDTRRNYGGTSGDANLNNRFNFTTLVDLFPAGAEQKMVSLKVENDGTDPKALNSYVEGNKFDPTHYKFTPVQQDGTERAAILPTDSDFKGLKFYVQKKDTTDALTTSNYATLGDQLTTATGFTKDHNGKKVYAVYTDSDNVTVIAEVGTVTIADKSVSSISINTDPDNASNNTTFGQGAAYYTGDAIRTLVEGASPAEQLILNVTYDNGDTALVKYVKDGAYDLFKVVDGKYVALAADEKLAVGANEIYVGLKGDATAGKNVTGTGTPTVEPQKITITATTDTMYIKQVEETPAVKLHYALAEDTPGDKHNIITFDPGKVTPYLESKGALNPEAVTDIKTIADKFIFYVGNATGDDNAKKNPESAGNAYVNTTDTPNIYGTPYTDALEDAYIFAVPKTKTDATPVFIGKLGTRDISTKTGDIGTGYPVSTPTSYAPKINDILDKENIKITVKFDNGDPDKAISLTEFIAMGGTISAENKDGDSLGPVTADTKLVPAMTKLNFTYNGTKIASLPITVAKKTINYTIKSYKKADNTVEAPTKTYDQGTGIGENYVIKAEIQSADLLDGDVPPTPGPLEVSGITYEYSDEHVNWVSDAAGDKDIIATIGALGLKNYPITNFNDRYTLQPATGTYTDTTVETKKKLTNIKGKITQKDLEITAINGVTTNKLDAEPAADVTVNGTADQTQFTTADLLTGDKLTINYTATYPKAFVTTESAKTGETYTADKDVTIAINSKSGANANDYNVTTRGIKGVVTAKTVTGIKATAPAAATYPAQPDLSQLVVNQIYGVNEEGPATTAYTLQLADGTAIDPDNPPTFPVGETEITVVYSPTIQTTFKVKVNPKQIPLSKVLFSPTKVHGKDITDEGKVYGFGPESGVLPADIDKIKVTYTAAFDDDNVADPKNATITNIALAPKTEGDTTWKNYVIVNDGTDEPATTTTTTTGSITKGEQNKPANPTLELDQKTNNIVVSAPLSDNLEYAIVKKGQPAPADDDYSSSPSFEDLDKNTEYTVYTRVAGTDNLAPSEASTADLKTYKYLVTARAKKNAEKEEPDYSGYTNGPVLADANAVHAVVNGGSKPSKFKAYYTDKATTAAVAYELDLASVAVDNVVDLYYTQSSGGSSGGGGGGGTSTYLAKFVATEKGTISDGKESVSVTSGSSVKAESIPTISPKDGYAFAGWSTDGKTAVDPTTVVIKKNTTFTALYEEADATATPAPTEAPEATTKPSTDKPTIDKNFTEPYASGYEDGSFGPDNNLTRAELATMIARLIEGKDISSSNSSSFYDVPSDAWYNKYVGYLEDKDVLSGYEDGSFRPENPVSRGEIATVIARAQKFAIDSYEGNFADVTDEDWPRDYIQTLANRGIASGYPDGTFGPYAPITRAEAVTMINKVLADSIPVVTFTPNDIAGHWGESEVILAVNKRELVDALAE